MKGGRKGGSERGGEGRIRPSEHHLGLPLAITSEGAQAANADRPSKKRSGRKEDRKCVAPSRIPGRVRRSADAKTREEITEMAVAADTNCGESKGGEGGNILARGGGNMHFSPPAPPWAFGQRIRSAGVWPRAASGPTLSQRRRPRRDWTPTTARTTASYGVMYWLPCSRGVRHTRPSFLLRVHDGLYEGKSCIFNELYKMLDVKFPTLFLSESPLTGKKNSVAVSVRARPRPSSFAA